MTIKENVLGVREIDCSEGISTEEYNQIDPHILACFPSRAYPVNLFHWKEEIRVLSPIYAVGNNVDRHLRARAQELSKDGLLFFSRKQIVEYTACVACNLDMAMEDPNLTWAEKSGLFIDELHRRQQEIFTHPLPPQVEDLQKALESLCAYLIEDHRRIAELVQDAHKDLSQDRRRINASIIALAIYIELNKGDIYMETLENIALGFMLYDIGMSRLSPMMLAKAQPLTPPERRTMREHPKLGVELLEKLNLVRSEISEPALQHHERLDGMGYPHKLSGAQIGDLGRIAGVADSYCAMITDCGYRPSKPPINAAAELVTNERKYDQRICRTLVRFLQTVQR